MKILSVLSTIILLFAIASFRHVEAWWCMGHGLVAQVALNNVEPKVRDIINSYFAYLHETGPFPMVTDAVEGACWPDDIKGYGLYPTGGWHFKDIGYFLDNYTLPDGFCLIQDTNLVTSLTDFFSAARKNSNPYSVAFALAFIVHNYGDIHQPLHCAALVDEKFPEGDAGGNFIKIKWNGETTNLHKFWDSICYQEKYDDLVRPMNASSKQFMYDTAMMLNKTWNNISRYDGTLYNADKMAEQSYEIAKQYVYNDLFVGPNNISTDGSAEVPTWYRDRCIPVAERQIVLGGMRLANTLTDLFKDSEMPTFPENIVANPNNDGSSTGRDAGMFFGGLVTATFVIAASAFFYYFFIYKNNNHQSRRRQTDSSPLVTPTTTTGNLYKSEEASI